MSTDMSRYHVIRFVLDVALPSHRAIGPSEQRADHWREWLKRVDRMFHEGMPHGLLAALAKEPKLLHLMPEYIDRERARCSKHFARERAEEARRDAWVARRNAGNARAKQEREAARQAREAQAKAVRRAEDEAAAEGIRAKWSILLTEFLTKREQDTAALLHAVD